MVAGGARPCGLGRRVPGASPTHTGSLVRLGFFGVAGGPERIGCVVGTRFPSTATAFNVVLSHCRVSLQVFWKPPAGGSALARGRSPQPANSPALSIGWMVRSRCTAARRLPMGSHVGAVGQRLPVDGPGTRPPHTAAALPTGPITSHVLILMPLHLDSLRGERRCGSRHGSRFTTCPPVCPLDLPHLARLHGVPAAPWGLFAPCSWRFWLPWTVRVDRYAWRRWRIAACRPLTPL